jgi:hypothetical protein
VGHTHYGRSRFSPRAHSSPRSHLNINFLTISIWDINFIAMNQKINRQPPAPRTGVQATLRDSALCDSALPDSAPSLCTKLRFCGSELHFFTRE